MKHTIEELEAELQDTLVNAVANEMAENYESAARFWGKAINICLQRAKYCALKNVSVWEGKNETHD